MYASAYTVVYLTTEDNKLHTEEGQEIDDDEDNKFETESEGKSDADGE